MKNLLCIMVCLLCIHTASGQFSTYTTSTSMSKGSSSNQSKQVNASTVRTFIKNGNCTQAKAYLEKFVKDYGSDPEVKYQCAILMQEVLMGFNLEIMQAVMMMNQSLVQLLQINQNYAEQFQILWLTAAASQGHQNAKQAMQYKAASMGIFTNGNTGAGNQTGSTKRGNCTYCNGKGWVVGNSTPTYGNTGSKWCEECNNRFSGSHSHDRCPSCGGRGYIEKSR